MRLLAVVVTVVLAGIGLVTPSLGDAPSPGDPGTPGANRPEASISVDSGPDGVTIYIAVSDGSPGGSTDPSSGEVGGAAGWSCAVNVMTIGNATREWFEEEAPLHPGEAPWVVRCENGYFAIVWLSVDTEPADIEIVVVPGDAIDPSAVAAELRDRVPVGDAVIGVNPAVGLVAVPSWFWVEGYDGSPIVASDTLGDVTVEVEITPRSYRWSFGDGASLETTSLGRPYPQESDIRHTYERSSLGAGGAYTVTLRITFSVRYRVNGGPWQPLDPITRSFETAYPVQQVQSILTGP